MQGGATVTQEAATMRFHPDDKWSFMKDKAGNYGTAPYAMSRAPPGAAQAAWSDATDSSDYTSEQGSDSETEDEVDTETEDETGGEKTEEESAFVDDGEVTLAFTSASDSDGEGGDKTETEVELPGRLYKYKDGDVFRLVDERDGDIMKLKSVIVNGEFDDSAKDVLEASEADVESMNAILSDRLGEMDAEEMGELFTMTGQFVAEGMSFTDDGVEVRGVDKTFTRGGEGFVNELMKYVCVLRGSKFAPFRQLRVDLGLDWEATLKTADGFGRMYTDLSQQDSELPLRTTFDKSAKRPSDSEWGYRWEVEFDKFIAQYNEKKAKRKMRMRTDTTIASPNNDGSRKRKIDEECNIAIAAAKRRIAVEKGKIAAARRLKKEKQARLHEEERAEQDEKKRQSLMKQRDDINAELAKLQPRAV
jgi:hypothetical protein